MCPIIAYIHAYLHTCIYIADHINETDMDCTHYLLCPTHKHIPLPSQHRAHTGVKVRPTPHIHIFTQIHMYSQVCQPPIYLGASPYPRPTWGSSHDQLGLQASLKFAPNKICTPVLCFFGFNSNHFQAELTGNHRGSSARTGMYSCVCLTPPSHCLAAASPSSSSRPQISPSSKKMRRIVAPQPPHFQCAGSLRSTRSPPVTLPFLSSSHTSPFVPMFRTLPISRLLVPIPHHHVHNHRRL